MADVNIGELAASVWDKVIGKKPNDNIFNARALFYLMSEDGFQEKATGGKTFEFTVEYAENSTFKSYGEFETLDTSRINVFDAAQFVQKQHAGTINFSDWEQLRATGDSAKFEYVAGKLENGKNSHISDLNRALFGDGTGNGGQNIDGLKKIIPVDPTTGIVGGINRATFPFWRSQQTSGTKTSGAYDNLRAAMRSVYNLCSRGGTEDAPTSWITDRSSFEGYQSLLTPGERFNKDKENRGGDAGWDNKAMMFNGIPGLYDEDAANIVPGNLYFLNPKFMKLCYLEGAWMKMKKPVEPAAQLAVTYRLFTIAQLCTGNSRRLGVVSSIT